MLARTILLGIMSAPLAAIVAAQGPSSIQLTVVPPTARVFQADAVEGLPNADIACARGEWESFQVVVSAGERRLSKADASISALTSAEGKVLDLDNITLYREAYVPVRHSAPRATVPPGLFPDPLVPFINPYTGERIPEPVWDGAKRRGPRFGAADFEVWPDRHQPLWVDVYVPANTAPGVYEGTLRVTADDTNAAELPVRVTVWDFVLPEGPTHENHFGGFGSLRAYHHLEKDDAAYDRLEDRYMAMLAAHRINPPIPARLNPKVAEDGTAQFDEALEKQWVEFVAKYHVTYIQVPNAPFGDAIGTDRLKALQFHRSWYAFLEKHGWAAGAYVYMLDEPNDPEAYERARQLGALVQEAEPKLRRLVVEQPYTENPEWGTLDGAMDIWCPLFGFVHEPSVQRVQANGNAVWSYTALVQHAPPYHPEYELVKNDHPPYWQMDFPVTAYRIAPWLNHRYGITGLLYWATVYWGSPDRNPWDDPGFRIRWNGEGALFYPGEDAGIDGPVASIRLKNLRDGMEDYEYFALLEQRGGKSVVEEVVRSAVPTWGAWRQEPEVLPALRQQLAEAILARKN